MAWFGQGKDTIEWLEHRDDLLFYKWPSNEIKKGSRLVIRAGQHACFYSNGRMEGIFEEPGNFDVVTQITPFLSTLSGAFALRSDSGLRAEVYFVNAKQFLLPWGTRQRLMIPSPDVPSGIPVGCNGNVVIGFRDYLTFITKIAGIRSAFSLNDISERIMGEINPIIAECMLEGQFSLGVNALIALQSNNRKLAKRIGEELDKELFDIGLTVIDFNILSFNYPKELQQMAEKAAAHSFVTDVNKYTSVQLADSFDNGGSGGQMVQMAAGLKMSQQILETPAKSGDLFCTKCRKMVSSKFCPDCGTQTV